MKPFPTIADLGRRVVKRDDIYRWFVWFPPSMSWLKREFVHERGEREWVVASKGAPRWA